MGKIYIENVGKFRFRIVGRNPRKRLGNLKWLIKGTREGGSSGFIKKVYEISPPGFYDNSEDIETSSELLQSLMNLYKNSI